jgi:ferric-dicitrate binding protein FerR (iron transport regulator)
MSQSIENSDPRLELLHAQQASAWVQALLDPTAEQRAAFVRWLKLSPRNVRDFLFMLTIEQALDHLDTDRLHDIEALLAQVDGRVVPLGAAWPRVPAGPRVQTPPRAVSIRRRRLGKWFAAAASLMAASLVTWSFLAHESYGWKEFSTTTGEQRAFELEDGSVIHLNTSSKIALRFAAQAREVRLLQGEALFRVHHDAVRPFRVYTSDAVIQAVGTQFNVYNRPDGTEVAVIEGRVNVTPESHPSLAKFNVPAMGVGEDAATRTVGASEEARVDPGGILSVRAVPDVADAVAWRERRLVFRQETLEHIVAEFNRYSARQMHLEGADVSRRVFSGVFDADDPDSLAQVLARDPSLSVSYSDHGIAVNAR